MNLPLISIVIPVYNVARYLRECLFSIIRQTYKNLEIICINDGSTDNSVSILSEFQRNDSRIVVINQKNKGLSAARNAGLKHITSDYVIFVDSDDYVDPRYVEVLYNVLYKENADFSLCGILPVGNNVQDNLRCTYWLQNKMKPFSNGSINPNNIVMMAWGKLFKVEIIKQHLLQFPEGLVNEDNYWHFLYCTFSKKYAISNEKLYCYRKDNPNAITKKTIFQKEHCYDIIKICCRIFDSLSSNENSDIYIKYLDDFFFTQLDNLVCIHKKSSIDKSFWNEIQEYLVRSNSAKEKFKTSKFLSILGADLWL